MPRPRLLALDLDGTLLGLDGEVSPRTRQAVQGARDAGIVVVVCTGRRFRTTKRILDELELEGPAVVHNGALVKRGATGETLASHCIEPSTYRHVLSLLRRYASPLVYLDGYHEGLDMLAEPVERSHAFQATYLDDYVDSRRIVESLDRHPGRDVLMMSLMAEESDLAALREELDQELGEESRTNFLMNKNYEGYILEVVSSRASKWNGLADIAGPLGIEASEIMAVGDDRNDIELIAGAGLGVAMGNAVDAVKAVAQEITGSCEDDGVAQVIERFLL